MRFSPTQPFSPGHPEHGIHRKGFSDWFDPKSLIEGPLGNVKAAAKGDWDKALMPAGAGDAARPSVAKGYLKATFDPSYQYKFSDRKWEGKPAPLQETKSLKPPPQTGPLSRQQEMAEYKRQTTTRRKGAGTGLLT